MNNGNHYNHFKTTNGNGSGGIVHECPHHGTVAVPSVNSSNDNSLINMGELQQQHQPQQQQQQQQFSHQRTGLPPQPTRNVSSTLANRFNTNK